MRIRARWETLRSIALRRPTETFVDLQILAFRAVPTVRSPVGRGMTSLVGLVFAETQAEDQRKKEATGNAPRVSPIRHSLIQTVIFMVGRGTKLWVGSASIV